MSRNASYVKNVFQHMSKIIVVCPLYFNPCEAACAPVIEADADISDGESESVDDVLEALFDSLDRT